MVRTTLHLFPSQRLTPPCAAATTREAPRGIDRQNHLRENRVAYPAWAGAGRARRGAAVRRDRDPRRRNRHRKGPVAPARWLNRRHLCNAKMQVAFWSDAII